MRYDACRDEWMNEWMTTTHYDQHTWPASVGNGEGKNNRGQCDAMKGTYKWESDLRCHPVREVHSKKGTSISNCKCDCAWVPQQIAIGMKPPLFVLPVEESSENCLTFFNVFNWAQICEDDALASVNRGSGGQRTRATSDPPVPQLSCMSNSRVIGDILKALTYRHRANDLLTLITESPQEVLVVH